MAPTTPSGSLGGVPGLKDGFGGLKLTLVCSTMSEGLSALTAVADQFGDSEDSEKTNRIFIRSPSLVLGHVENDRAEVDFQRRLFFVRVGEMAVHFADQNSAVTVPDPRGDGHKIKATHNARADECVP